MERPREMILKTFVISSLQKISWSLQTLYNTTLGRPKAKIFRHSSLPASEDPVNLELLERPDVVDYNR